jgi:hypothetical protein
LTTIVVAAMVTWVAENQDARGGLPLGEWCAVARTRNAADAG